MDKADDCTMTDRFDHYMPTASARDRIAAAGITPAKRALDLVLVLVLGVLVALPLLILILVLLAVEGRPVFHISDRMKAPGQRFRLVKLRSMRPEPGGDGVTGGEKAGRISRLQRLLRASRADELPQLWNVLVGDMSMVGPRPPIPRMVAAHPALYARVLRSRPGITGLATLRFHRHEERILASCRTAAETEAAYRRRCIERKARIDLIYQRNRTIWLDLRIIAETALLPLRRLVRRLQAGAAARQQPITAGLSGHSPRGSATASATGSRPSLAGRKRAPSPAHRPHAHMPHAIRPDHLPGAARSHRAAPVPPPG